MSFQVSLIVSITSFMRKGSVSEPYVAKSCDPLHRVIFSRKQFKSFLDFMALMKMTVFFFFFSFGRIPTVNFCLIFLMIRFGLYIFGRNITKVIMYFFVLDPIGCILFQYVSLLMIFTVIT